MINFVIVKEVQLPNRTPCRCYLTVDFASTYEDAVEKLSKAMYCKWGKNETFALMKVLISGITTICPHDIPDMEEILKLEKMEDKNNG